MKYAILGAGAGYALMVISAAIVFNGKDFTSVNELFLTMAFTKQYFVLNLDSSVRHPNVYAMVPVVFGFLGGLLYSKVKDPATLAKDDPPNKEPHT